MSHYSEIYLKRLNRYGYDYQSRVQGQREREFEDKLLKSVYRVDFWYDGECHPATLERCRQDKSQTTQYLLTRANLNIPNGTILTITDSTGKDQQWMIYWLEFIAASGYNRYMVLKMTHYIEWIDKQNVQHSSWCYIHGAGDEPLRETLKITSSVYTENDNLLFAIMPANENLRREDYFELGEGALREGYRVIGYDVQTTLGIEYVSLNPIYVKNNEASIKKQESEYNWLDGGVS